MTPALFYSPVQGHAATAYSATPGVCRLFCRQPLCARGNGGRVEDQGSGKPTTSPATIVAGRHAI